MRCIVSILLALVTVVPPLAHGRIPAERLVELKAKAEQMASHDRGKIYSEIALELVDAANQQFTDGDSDKALATVQEVLTFAKKAGEAAEERGKKIKDTEINLRSCARRLEELARTLALVDREPVKATADEINKVRDHLLSVMFAPKRKK